MKDAVDSRVSIRPYLKSDAEATSTIFQEAITVTASADYTPEQIAAWARPESRDVAGWNRSMRGRDSYVAVVDEQVVGFSDVDADGYVDMMFVSPRFSRQGVARSLMTFLEARARAHGAQRLFADVSITARPFFEASGFRVDFEQHPVAEGIVMTNFRMTKVLEPLPR